MAWPKGTPRPPGAGRAKGTPNKVTSDLLAICERKGINPFEALLELSNHPDVGIKIQALKEVCQYIYPKRKALEVDSTINVELAKKAQEYEQLSKEKQIELMREEIQKLEAKQ